MPAYLDWPAENPNYEAQFTSLLQSLRKDLTEYIKDILSPLFLSLSSSEANHYKFLSHSLDLSFPRSCEIKEKPQGSLHTHGGACMQDALYYGENESCGSSQRVKWGYGLNSKCPWAGL